MKAVDPQISVAKLVRCVEQVVQNAFVRHVAALEGPERIRIQSVREADGSLPSSTEEIVVEKVAEAKEPSGRKSPQRGEREDEVREKLCREMRDDDIAEFQLLNVDSRSEPDDHAGDLLLDGH